MKIKEGFLLRKVAGETVVIPTGETLDLNIMITLNGTGEFLWNRLQQDTTEEALVAAMLEDNLDMVVGCRRDQVEEAYRRGHRFGNWALTSL